VIIEDLGLNNGFRHIIANLENGESFNLSMSLAGIYQLKNIKGILWTCKVLNENGLPSMVLAWKSYNVFMEDDLN
jgi:hypothetical protein